MTECPREHRHVILDKDSLRFLHCLSSRDANVRQQAMDSLSRTIDAWTNGYGSPPDHPVINNASPHVCDTMYMLQEHLPDILRLSECCPFDDVREWCRCLLSDLKVRNWLYLVLQEWIWPFMPPAWKVRRGHLVIGSSVRLSIHPSVCPYFCPAYILSAIESTCI